MPRATRTRRVSAAQARIYLGKAEEFLVAARDTLEAGHSLAATSLAVHAGISAGDAICGARTGQRAAGSDHGQVVALLNQAGREGTDAVRVLTHWMPLKNRAEYEPEDVPKATARRTPSSMPSGSSRSLARSSRSARLPTGRTSPDTCTGRVATG